ncbi:MAG: hypothetical protein AABZ55_00850 [Bdellovibrionota bacterium]
MKRIFFLLTLAAFTLLNQARAGPAIECGSPHMPVGKGYSITIEPLGDHFEYKFLKNTQNGPKPRDRKSVLFQTGKPGSDSCELYFTNTQNRAETYLIKNRPNTSDWVFLMPPGHAQVDMKCKIKVEFKEKFCDRKKPGFYPVKAEIPPACNETDRVPCSQ